MVVCVRLKNDIHGGFHGKEVTLAGQLVSKIADKHHALIVSFSNKFHNKTKLM